MFQFIVVKVLVEVNKRIGPRRYHLRLPEKVETFLFAQESKMKNKILFINTHFVCICFHKVAIIVPYRDRQPHLRVLLHYLHLLLQRQLINYRILVAEPNTTLNKPFNKGRVMNAAT